MYTNLFHLLSYSPKYVSPIDPIMFTPPVMLLTHYVVVQVVYLSPDASAIASSLCLCCMAVVWGIV